MDALTVARHDGTSLLDLGYDHVGLDDCWQSCDGKGGSNFARSRYFSIQNTLKRKCDSPLLMGSSVEIPRHSNRTGFHDKAGAPLINFTLFPCNRTAQSELLLVMHMGLHQSSGARSISSFVCNLRVSIKLRFALKGICLVLRKLTQTHPLITTHFCVVLLVCVPCVFVNEFGPGALVLTFSFLCVLYRQR